jgi:hypothetical protein
MEFKSKIDKILSIKDIKLWKLAEISGLNSTLEKAYTENREMRETQTDKFLQNLRINSDWWKNGEGEIFLPEVIQEKQSDSNEMEIKHPPQKPDLNLLFIDTIKLLIEKNDKLVQGEIGHLRGNENWFKEEFSKLTSKLGPSNDS